MAITHIVKAPNTRLLSGEWNANHNDSKAYRDTQGFSMVAGSIVFALPQWMDFDNVTTGANLGFIPTRSGSITGISICATNLAGDVASTLRAAVNIGILVPALGIDIIAAGNQTGSATQAEGILTFNANDIVHARLYNITSPILPITFDDAIVYVEVTYD